MRDFQRRKVYRWENRVSQPFRKELSLAECERLIKRVFRNRKLPVPEVRDGRGCRRAYGGKRYIKLPKRCRDDAIVLHECAHGIVGWRNGGGHGHGPEFVRTMIKLWVSYMDIPFTEYELIASAEDAGLRLDK